jgi:hypothetical protein
VEAQARCALLGVGLSGCGYPHVASEAADWKRIGQVSSSLPTSSSGGILSSRHSHGLSPRAQPRQASRSGVVARPAMDPIQRVSRQSRGAKATGTS